MPCVPCDPLGLCPLLTSLQHRFGDLGFSGIIEKWHKSSAILVGSVVLGHLDSFSKIVSASDAGFAVVSFAAGNGHLAACKFLLQLDPGMIFALSSWHVFDP
jgi:hypothetical protein